MTIIVCVRTRAEGDVSAEVPDLSLQAVGVGVQQQLAGGDVGGREREARHHVGVEIAIGIICVEVSYDL